MLGVYLLRDTAAFCSSLQTRGFLKTSWLQTSWHRRGLCEKHVCCLAASGLCIRDTTYFSRNMHSLPVGKVYIVHLSVFLNIFQDAYEYFCGILSTL